MIPPCHHYFTIEDDEAKEPINISITFEESKYYIAVVKHYITTDCLLDNLILYLINNESYELDINLVCEKIGRHFELPSEFYTLIKDKYQKALLLK